jgi:hypothetical protein
MAKIIKNNTGSDKIYAGQTIESEQSYQILSNEESQFQNSELLLTDLTSGDACIWDSTINPVIELTGASAVQYLLSAVTQKVIQTLGTDRFTLKAQGFKFQPTKDSTTSHDYELVKSYAIKGGCFFSDDCQVGDYAKCQIVDVNNVLGYGAGLVLSEYVEKWYMTPGHLIDLEDVSVGILPVAGLFFRVVFTSTSQSVDPTCVMNLKLYEVS